MNLWLAVGALVLVALAFVLFPLWRHRRRLAASNEPGRAGNDLPASTGAMSAPAGRHDKIGWPAVGALGMLPVLTVGLYIYLGAPAIIKEQALTQAQARYDVEGMVRALEDKLKSTPNDPEGWYALGRAYIAFERYADAEEALRKAVAQAPKDARLIAQYAEALALKQGSLDGRPLELLQEALEINYEEEKALELAGLAAFQKERWAEALHYWRRLLKKLPKETEQYEAISAAVRNAEKNLEVRLGGTGVPVPPPPRAPASAPH